MKNAQVNFAREALFSKSLYSDSFLGVLKGCFAASRVPSSMVMSDV